MPGLFACGLRGWVIVSSTLEDGVQWWLGLSSWLATESLESSRVDNDSTCFAKHRLQVAWGDGLKVVMGGDGW